MNLDRQIKRLGVVLALLFVALFAKLNELQVVRAEELANHPGNTRGAIRDFSRPRGRILSADGAVLAESEPVDSRFERLRTYPEGELFSHLTGFFSFTYGSTGLEDAYNEELTGRGEARLSDVRDVLVDAERTADVTITASKRLQAVAAEALGERRGSVVAIDPRTGAVLAMVSYPRYDPGRLSGHDQGEVQEAYQALIADPAKPLQARSYRETFSPGSTFKVVTAAAAIERAPELVDKAYPPLARLDLPQTTRELGNFGGGTCGGNLASLLRVSCNTGFGAIALDLGADRLTAEAEDFGFNSQPPIDLPAAATSRFPRPEDPPALARAAIGQQSVTATPLQMALVAAAVGNGGVAMRPHLLDAVRDDDGEVVRRYSPEPWVRATSPEAAATLRDDMVGVVNAGTARGAAVAGAQVAAKTGTAQTGPAGDTSHAWLVAFAPAESPRVAVAVIVESQPGLGDITGGRVAAPVAATVMAAALAVG